MKPARSLYNSMGQLAYTPCIERDQVKQLEGEAPGDSLASYLAYWSIKRNFVLECRVRELDPKANKKILKAAFKYIKARLPGNVVVQDAAPELRTKYTDEGWAWSLMWLRSVAQLSRITVSKPFFVWTCGKHAN